MTKEQLGTLILNSERQLYSAAKTILFSDQDCADAIQETIVKAFSKIETLRNDKYARTWLIRILINECYTLLRKSSKKAESVKQKLVYVTATYTNQSEEEINHMLYLGTLVRMNHEAGMYHIYYPTEPEQSGDDYDYVIGDGAAHTGEMTYYSVSEEYGNGGNYIPSLKAGESIQVNMAWIVNENDLDKMYLDFNTAGGPYEFSDAMLKTGLVNICQQ